MREKTDNTEVDEVIEGSQFTIVHCVGAKNSLEEALDTFKATKRDSLRRALWSQFERKANNQRMAERSWRAEGDLPNEKGINGGKFYAFKKIPIRAYCWFSQANKGKLFISHYIVKKTDKLAARDITRTQNNWRRIELNGDER